MDGQRKRDIEAAFCAIKAEGFDQRFESIVCRLLRRIYPNINPTPPKHDLGQDATASPLVPVRMSDRWYSFSISLTSRYAKLEADCRRCAEARHNIDVMVFVTWESVTGRTRKTWTERVGTDFGWNLEIYDQQFLLMEAEAPENEGYVADLLGVGTTTLYLPALRPALPANILVSEVVSKLARQSIKRGIELRESWHPAAAIEVFASTLQDCSSQLSDADVARIHTNLGAAYRDLGDDVQAENHLEAARALAPEDMRVRTNLALLALAKKQYGKALEIMEEGLRELGDSAYALNVSANALWDLGRDDEAMERVDKAIRLDPAIGPPHVLRGLILRLRGDIDQALVEFTLAVELDSKDLFAQGVRIETAAHLALNAHATVDVDDLDRSSAIWVHELEKAGSPLPVSLHGAAAAAYSARGLTSALKRDWSQAVPAFQKAAAYSDSPIFHQNLAVTYAKAGLIEEAAREFRVARDGGIDNCSLLHDLASTDIILLEEQQGKDTGLLAEAKECLQYLKEQEPDERGTWYLEARVVIAESKCECDDMGLGRAKALLLRVITDPGFTTEQAIGAALQLQEAERVERCVEESKRVR